MILELSILGSSSNNSVLCESPSSDASVVGESPHPGEVIDEEPIQEEIATEICMSAGDTKIFMSADDLFYTMSSTRTMYRSSFLDPVKLMPFGKKDIVAGFYMMLLGVLQAGIYWSFTLVNERRTLPSNTSLNASSTFEAELQVNGTFFCSSNVTLPSTSSDSNNSVLNITTSFTFYEIATCLGWIDEHFIARIFKLISLGLRYSLTAVTFFWAATSIGKFKR